MAADIRDSARYRETIAQYRAMVEPGLGAPSSFEAAELSPDGRLVAVVCRIADTLEGRGRTEVRIVPVDGSPAWTVTPRDGDAGGPRWSPDGRQLAYLADHGDRHRFGPWLVSIADGPTAGEPRRLDAPPGIAEQLRWSPDGTRLLLIMAGEQAEQADGLGSGTMGQDIGADAPSWYPEVETTEGDDEWRSAWSLDVTSGAMERRSPVGLNVWEADWLGNDATVAVVSDAPAEDAWYRARVVRLGPNPGEVAPLHVPQWQVQFVEGSPDGLRAAVIEGVASDRYFVAGDVIVVEADGSGARSLGWMGADIGAVRWDGPGRLVAVGTDGMETVLLALDPDGATPIELYRAAAEPAGAWTQLSAAGGRVAIALTDAAEPDRVAVVEGGVALTLLGTDHPGRDLVRAAVAAKRVETWTARDGTRVQGVLLLPHGEPPFASILWVHGGPVGAVGLGFEPPIIGLLVGAGYAVLTPNPRGSTGRGRDFAAAVVGDMGGEDAQDLLAAADHLVTSGIADPARLVVAGVSYGGYMAAYLPSIDDRFAAAIVGSPLTDLVSSYYGSSLTVFVHDYVGGRPEADIDRYVARSAVFAGASLRTPTLISVGLRDRATPPGQAAELFRALRDQGVPAELLRYPEEGHGVRAIEARMDWVARILVWLERFAPARGALPSMS
jgi:dipeptidyl aminopeptidase/acylaminoacyl peptidase